MNKINLEIYDPNKTYVFPNMQLATPEKIALDYSVVNIPNAKIVITTDASATMFYAVELMLSMAQRLGVDTTQYETDEEILVAMEEVLNEPQPEAEPTAEERIASALEYQNMMSI